MKGFNPSFGQEAAKNYGNSPRGDEDGAVRFLAQFIDVEWMELDRVGFDVNRYDPVTQVLDENHVEISADGIRFGPIRQRLTYPSEFDLMARDRGTAAARAVGRLER
ncbi:hypothetical protein [Lentzea sp.]|uniref:hypothetical protein n=1 Tax=Lentzea sp. TaxID=56099 RepID=UPI002BCFD68A|nr:hypothetical protein [Lentzea sp.]HUQ60754.1 hypothetical protein [Lentzea sp.]